MSTIAVSAREGQNTSSIEFGISPPARWRGAIVLPREHGTWAMFYLPLLTGAAIGYLSGGRSWRNLAGLSLASTAAFLLRTPAEASLGFSVVKPANATERIVARSTVFALATIFAVAILLLTIRLQPLWPVALAASAAIMLRLLARNRRLHFRDQLTGSFVLTSGSFVAFYGLRGAADSSAIAVWLLNWAFAADQIFYVQSRIQCFRRREDACDTARHNHQAVAAFIVIALLLGVGFSVLPWLAAAAYAPLLIRGWIGIHNPRTPSMRMLGFQELGLTVLSSILLIAGFAIKSHG